MAQVKRFALMAAVIFAAGAATMVAQQDTAQPATSKSPKPVTERAEVTETFIVEAIDYQNRLVTLKDKDGDMEVIKVGPQIQRFNELNAGDKINVRYYESMVYTIRPAGQAPPASAGGTSVTRDTGAKPGGTMSQTLTATVTVTALDPSVPSVAVKTDDGKSMSFKIRDKKNLEGVKVGDRVDITYTQALAIKVQ